MKFGKGILLTMNFIIINCGNF